MERELLHRRLRRAEGLSGARLAAVAIAGAGGGVL